MKKTKLNVLCILLMAHMSGLVQAGFVGSAVELDLEQISFTPLSGDVTLEFENESNQVLVNADGDISEASGLNNALASNSGAGGLAEAGSSSDELFVSSEVDTEGTVEAFAEHSVDYTAQGEGAVKITVDYLFLIISSDANNQDSELFVQASLFQQDSGIFDEASLSVGEGEDLALIIPGELEIMLLLADGDTGTLVFNAGSFADLSIAGVGEVPLPPAIILFASSVLGLTAVRRRQAG